jgi:5-formyltetrahydrofolate cyclo-ligase
MTADRASVLALRRKQDPEAAARLSLETIRRFTAECGIAPTEWRGVRVGLYRSMPVELDLRMLETLLTGWGAELSFPRVLDAGLGLMEFAQGLVRPAGADPSLVVEQKWRPGAFGIEEPPSHHPVVDPGTLDVIFVPGAAFGEQGERAGMGAGFYDRFLPKAHKALRVALAFDFQLLPKLDQQPWDQRMDWIWTERRRIVLKPWKPPVRNQF